MLVGLGAILPATSHVSAQVDAQTRGGATHGGSTTDDDDHDPPGTEPNTADPSAVEPDDRSTDARDTEAETPTELDAVVVTGTRRAQRLGDVPVATEVVGRDEIDASNAETVAEILEERVGVDVQSTFRGQALQVDGLEPEHTLILIDGERVAGRIGGALDLSRLHLEDVERIELVRGASSSLYGSDAIAGVINIITRTGDGAPWRVETRATYGYQDRHRNLARTRFAGGPRPRAQSMPRDGYGGTYDVSGTVSRQGDHGSGRITVGYHRLDAFDLDPRDEATSGAALSTFTISGRGRTKLSRRIDLETSGQYLLRNEEALDLRGRQVFERLVRTEQVQLAAGPRITLSGGGELLIRGSYSLFRDQFLQRLRGGTGPTPDEDTRESIGELTVQLNHPLGSAHLLTVGYDAQIQKLTSERLTRPGSRARLSPYVQHEWTVSTSPRVVLVPGFRVDVDTTFGAAPAPKLAVRVDPTEDLVLRASGGRGFRAPDFREQLLRFQNASVGYVVEGNPDLDPETSWGINGSAEWRMHARLTASVSGFANFVDNLISTTTISASGDSLRFQYVNIAEARTAGGEVSLQTRPVDELRIDLAYGFLDAVDQTSGRRLDGRARHRATLKSRYEHASSGLGMTVRAMLVGKRPYTTGTEEDVEPTVVETQPYLQLDARVEKAFGDHWQVFVGVDNALNNGGTYLAVRPRTFLLGLSAGY